MIFRSFKVLSWNHKFSWALVHFQKSKKRLWFAPFRNRNTDFTFCTVSTLFFNPIKICLYITRLLSFSLPTLLRAIRTNASHLATLVDIIARSLDNRRLVEVVYIGSSLECLTLLIIMYHFVNFHILNFYSPEIFFAL